MKKNCTFVLDDFCMRQFDKDKAGLGFINYNQAEFTKKIQEAYDNDVNVELKEGYAPFCKHIFVKNFTDTVPTFLKITE